MEKYGNFCITTRVRPDGWVSLYGVRDMSAEIPLERILRKHELPQYVGLKRSAIDSLVKHGKFPPGMFLNDARNVRGWTLSEVQEWQARWISDRRRKTRAHVAARQAAIMEAIENGSDLPRFVNQIK